MKGKERAAKTIRVLSVPPVMVSALILILYFTRREYFHHPYEMCIVIVLLGFVPILAYPLQRYIPGLKDKGRDGQRKLAFITNLIGYIATFVWALIAEVESGLLLLCSTYFFSVFFLTLCNVFHFKASGHASSFTGPMLVLVYALGWKALLPCAIVSAAIVWSSLELKRHTLQQILGGMGTCALAFSISLLLIQIIR